MFYFDQIVIKQKNYFTYGKQSYINKVQMFCGAEVNTYIMLICSRESNVSVLVNNWEINAENNISMSA